MFDQNWISEVDAEWDRKKILVSPKKKKLPYTISGGIGVSDEELIRLHTVENLSALEIAKRTHKTDYMVRQRLKVLKVYHKGKRAMRRTDLNDKHIKWLYNRGYSPREIGGIVGAPKRTILKYLKHLNVTPSKLSTPVQCVRIKVLNHILDKETAFKKFANKKKKKPIVVTARKGSLLDF